MEPGAAVMLFGLKTRPSSPTSTVWTPLAADAVVEAAECDDEEEEEEELPLLLLSPYCAATRLASRLRLARNRIGSLLRRSGLAYGKLRCRGVGRVRSSFCVLRELSRNNQLYITLSTTSWRALKHTLLSSLSSPLQSDRLQHFSIVQAASLHQRQCCFGRKIGKLYPKYERQRSMPNLALGKPTVRESADSEAADIPNRRPIRLSVSRLRQG